MYINTPNKPIETIWSLTKIILTVCMFFWFGWKVGLLALLLTIEIKGV